MLGKVKEEDRVVVRVVEDCVHCGEDRCVWLANKERMVLIDETEHGYLPDDSKPPNNARRKKLYREMTLLLNKGPLGVGVRKKLPRCVENGARALFPSPSFMGFKNK